MGCDYNFMHGKVIQYCKDRCKNNKLDGSVTWVDNEIFNSWSCIDYEKYGICKDGRVIDEGNKLLDLALKNDTRLLEITILFLKKVLLPRESQNISI